MSDKKPLSSILNQSREITVNEKELPVALKHNKELVDFQDKNGNTMLHWAVKRQKLGLVKLLIAYGANVHIKNNRGKTPLDRAVRTRNNHIIYLLRKQMSDTSFQTSGKDPEVKYSDKIFLNDVFNFVEHETEEQKWESGKADVNWHDLMTELQRKGKTIRNMAGVSR